MDKDPTQTPDVIMEVPAFVKEALAAKALAEAQEDERMKAAHDAQTRENEAIFNATIPEGISPITLDPNHIPEYRELTPATVTSRHRQF